MKLTSYVLIKTDIGRDENDIFVYTRHEIILFYSVFLNTKFYNRFSLIHQSSNNVQCFYFNNNLKLFILISFF